MLSFCMRDRCDNTIPSAWTASRPSRRYRAPFRGRITRSALPALVAMLPPIRHDPRAPRSIGSRKPGVPGSILRRFKHRPGAHDHGARRPDRFPRYPAIASAKEPRRQDGNLAPPASPVDAAPAAPPAGRGDGRFRAPSISPQPKLASAKLSGRSRPVSAGVRAMGDAFESPRPSSMHRDQARRAVRDRTSISGKLSIPVRRPSIA